MTTKSKTAGSAKVRSIVITRVFDAPRELVYKVCTQPEHVVNWWGPRGFTNTMHGMDVRVGGVWRFTMHGPDGKDYPNKIEYLEVSPPKKLVFLHGDGGDTDRFKASMVFATM